MNDDCDEHRRVATLEEVEEAIDGLSPEQMKRLEIDATYRIVNIGRAARGRSGEDLLEEAVLRTLDGRRNWYCDACDFPKHIMGVVQSVASDWAKKHKRSGVEEVVFHAEALSHSSKTAVECPATAHDLVVSLKTHFAGDQETLDVMDGLSEGYEASEVRELLEMDQKRWDTLMKRIRRAAARLVLAKGS